MEQSENMVALITQQPPGVLPKVSDTTTATTINNLNQLEDASIVPNTSAKKVNEVIDLSIIYLFYNNMSFLATPRQNNDPI